MRNRGLWLALALVASAGCDDGGGGGGGEVDGAVTPDGMVAPPDAGADGAPPPTDAGGDAAPPPDAGGDAAVDEAQAALLGVPESERWPLPGLSAPVQVIRTEAGIPHVYARNRTDLARTLGFVLARDRYFVMDLQRRLGLGQLSDLLGDVALENDLEARGNGITFVADRLLANLSPELGAYFDAFAEGVNTYIEAVRAGEVPAPSELNIARGLLGATRVADLMKPWDRRSLAGMVAVVLYETNFEGDDIGRTDAAARLDGLFAEAPDEALRREGFRRDIWEDQRPLFDASSAAGLGLETAEGLQPPGPRPDRFVPGQGGFGPRRMAVPSEMLRDLAARVTDFENRMGRDDIAGFGSNAWAVAGTHTESGGALVAGDGHLQLSVPALMYQIGLDTSVFGGGDTHQTGLLLTGLPLLAVGTNGLVAWSQVNPVVDITDWYREEIRLDADGKPEASFFRGEWRPLEQVDEQYVVANVPILGSRGRTETWTRFATFDGRFLAQIEGRAVDPEVGPAPGESIVNLRGAAIIPADVDGDGKVTAISFDYGAFDVTKWIDALDAMGHATDMASFREATKGIVGGGLFSAAGDSAGDILFSSYQAIPCRSYLERGEDGRWVPGADPTMLLDGTVYGGFTLPTGANGKVDESQGAADPYRCVIPFEETPQALSPSAGFVFTANNDPGNLTTDGALHDDRWYLGGVWDPVRADTIRRGLRRATSGERGATVADMADIQANIDSRLGEVFTETLLGAITAGRAVAAEDASPEDQRLRALYAADAAAFDEVEQRLRAWAAAGYHTPSGVETFYHQPAEGEADLAVATMIFNAWFPRVIQRIWDDEPTQGAWRYSGDRQRVNALRRMFASRGGANAEDLASFNPATGESVFFDIVGTETVERSDEVVLMALTEALAFLRAAPDGPGEGGFGTGDMSQWLWGLRHQVKFESLLGGFLGQDSEFAAITDQFSITTRTLPLAEGLGEGDPRRGLKWFPRGGDQWNVDAANPGLGGTRFTHGNGPVMRMVIELKDGRVSGQNIVPGGQSGLTDSPHFSDQARLWLANETVPLRFHPEDVAEGATGREVYEP